MVSIGRVYRRDAITPTRFPIFHQFEGLAVDRGLTLADLKGTLLHVMRALFGDDRAGAVPDALLPVHGAVRSSRTSPAASAAAPAAGPASSPAGSSSAARAWSTRRCCRTSARPRGVERLRLRARARAERHAPARHRRDPHCSGRQRPPRVLRQFRWPTTDARPGRRGSATTSRSTCRWPSSPSALSIVSAAEVERDRAARRRRRRRQPRPLSASAASSKPGSTRTPIDCSSAGRRRRGGASSDRVRRLELRRRRDRRRRAARRRARDGRSSSRRSSAATVSNGMILARERSSSWATDHTGILVLPDAYEPGTPLGGRAVRSARTSSSSRVDRQPPRPACPCTASRARCRRSTVSSSHRRRVRIAARAGRRRAGRRPDRRFRGLSALRRATLPRGPDRAVAAVAEARLVTPGCAPISNVVDVTNYVMLALGNPLHAFDHATLAGDRSSCVRRERGREAATLDGVGARTSTHVRPRDRRRRAFGRARRDHGRRGDGDHRGDDRRPARGRELRARTDPSHFGAAQAPDRGLQPLGEGRRPVSRAARRCTRDRADHRADRRPLDRRTRT